MPWQEHPEFPDVADEQVLWRYMPYAAYLEILHRRALHFSRLDTLRDPHEGRFDEWDSLRALDPETRVRVRAMLEPSKPEIAVCCWTGLQDESISQWERYAGGFGIAIQTTAGALKAAFADEAMAIHVGHVRYDSPSVLQAGGRLIPLGLAMRKLPAYRDEHEVRAAIWSQGSRAPRQDLRQRTGRTAGWPEEGWSVPVPIDALVHRVWTGPPWTPWFYEQVAAITERLGFDADLVERSTLMDEPGG